MEPINNHSKVLDPHKQHEEKDFVVAFLLSWLLGWFGADRFYLGYTVLGIIKLLTLGGLGIWALIDVILLAFGKMKDKNGSVLRGYEKNKVWVRVLSILQLLIFAPIIILTYIAFALSFNESFNLSINQRARDLERRNDMAAIQSELKQYYTEKGYYPLRLKELEGLSNKYCADPLEKETTCTNPSYMYEAYSANDYSYSCSNTEVKCAAYIITSSRMEASDNKDPIYELRSN